MSTNNNAIDEIMDHIGYTMDPIIPNNVIGDYIRDYIEEAYQVGYRNGYEKAKETYSYTDTRRY